MESYIIAGDEEIRKAVEHSLTKKLKSINTPFGYFGSKNNLSLNLVQNLPPHSCWVDAFCGSCAVTLSKKMAPIEIINDIDSDIVNVFKQIRDNHEDLCKLISLTPYARQELNESRIASSSDSDLEKARKFLVQAMFAVNGVFGKEKGGFSYSQSYSRNGRDARVNRWYNLPERLTLVVERLRSVRIENRNAIELIEMFSNRPATLLYLDPPYLADRSKGYNNDAFDDPFHIEMLRHCLKSKAMIFISGYDNAIYNELLSEKKGWSKRMIKTKTKDVSGKDYHREEVVWTNKFFEAANKTGKMALRLTKKEIKQNKINPERK